MEKIKNVIENLNKVVAENVFENLLCDYSNLPRSLRVSRSIHEYESIVKSFDLSLTENNEVFYTDFINQNSFFEIFKTIEGYQLYLSHFHFDSEKKDNIFDFTETFDFEKVSELVNLKNSIYDRIRVLVSNITFEYSRALASGITYLYTLIDDIDDFEKQYLI